MFLSLNYIIYTPKGFDIIALKGFEKTKGFYFYWQSIFSL